MNEQETQAERIRQYKDLLAKLISERSELSLQITRLRVSISRLETKQNAAPQPLSQLGVC